MWGKGLGTLPAGAGLWVGGTARQSSDKARFYTNFRVRLTNTFFQGEVDNIERQRNGDIRQIIDVILTIFEDRCIKKGVNINILEHLMDILKNVDIFQTPLKMTANKIKMEKK